MNREDLVHVPVVLLQVAGNALCLPVFWGRADGVKAESFGVERGRGLHVGCRIAALELRHFDDAAGVGVRQAQNIVIADKLFHLFDGSADITHEVFWFSVLLTDFGYDSLNGCAAAISVVGWNRRIGEVTAPKLA